jgi:hypothetical protein
MKDYLLSDAQDITTCDTTGKKSTNILDMELVASGGATILTNDQLVGVVNIIIPALAAQAATQGLYIYLVSSDNSDMSTGAIRLGMCFVSMAEMIAGCVKNIQVCVPLTQCFVGLWFAAHTTTLTTGQTVDAYFSIAPITLNDAVQKVPA